MFANTCHIFIQIESMIIRTIEIKKMLHKDLFIVETYLTNLIMRDDLTILGFFDEVEPKTYSILFNNLIII